MSGRLAVLAAGLCCWLVAPAAGQGWFPTLEGIASGRIPIPPGMEGFAVGQFPALDSPRRAPGGIHAIDGAQWEFEYQRRQREQQQQEDGGQPKPYDLQQNSDEQLRMRQQWQMHQQQLLQQQQQALQQWQQPQQQQQQWQQQQQQQQQQQGAGGTQTVDLSRMGTNGRVQIANVDPHEVSSNVEKLRMQVRMTPADPNAHAMLASQLQLLDMKSHSAGALPRESLFHYERALELGLASDLSIIYLNLGMLHMWMGNTEQAVRRFTDLLQQPDIDDNGRAEAYHYRADSLANLGRFEEAAKDYRAAIQVQPLDATAWAGLVQVLKEHPTAEGVAVDWAALGGELDSALHALGHDPDKSVARGKLHFASFQCMDKLVSQGVAAAKDRAWYHLVTANKNEFDRAVREGDYYRVKQFRRAQADQFVSIFQSGVFPPGIGSHHKVPVFVIGMMRSGSTLVEQILSTHSGVFGVGEDSVFGSQLESIVSTVIGAVKQGTMQALHEGVTSSADAVVNGMYQQVPSERRSSVRHIVDKQLFHFKNVGFIHLLFPHAPIIHTTRTFMDVIFSILRYNFNEAGLGWSFDLRELVEYYAHYKRTMDHWNTVLPAGRIFELKYEDMVAEQEGTTRRLLAHIGLPWEDAVLNFHQTERYVQTMSAAQVKRPIDGRAVGAWTKYKDLFEQHMPQLAQEFNLTGVLGHEWFASSGGTPRAGPVQPPPEAAADSQDSSTSGDEPTPLTPSPSAVSSLLEKPSTTQVTVEADGSDPVWL